MKLNSYKNKVQLDLISAVILKDPNVLAYYMLPINKDHIIYFVNIEKRDFIKDRTYNYTSWKD